jgi:hypothetical protein
VATAETGQNAERESRKGGERGKALLKARLDS